jgi:phospholipid/cholesterol/gamma-HCH transport system substrate-binding protein
MLRLKKETKIGVLFACSLIIFYLGSAFLKGSSLMSKNKTYYILYDDASGLKIANPVMTKGVTIGKVKDISVLYKEGNKIKVTIEVDKNFVFTTGTKCQLSASLISGFGATCIIVIHGDGEIVKEFEYLSGVADKSLTDAITPTIKNLEELVFLTNAFLMELAKNTSKIALIFDNIENMTRKINSIISKSESSIYVISKELSKLIQYINNPEFGITPFLMNLNNFMKILSSKNIEITIESIKEIASNLNIILTMTKNNKSSLAKILNDSELYDSLNLSVKNLNALFIDVKMHPNRYLNFSVFGNKNKK